MQLNKIVSVTALFIGVELCCPQIAVGQTELFKLLPSDGAAGDHFAQIDIDFDGVTIIVGADEDDDYGVNSGSAYLFDPTTGQQLFKLVPNDGAADDQFGNDVGIDESIAVVGAEFDDDNGADSGSVYVFDVSTGQQLHKLLPDDGAVGDRFGASVAVSGGIIIAGTVFDNDNGALSGSAYVFDATTGQQLFKLLPNDGAAGDRFGNRVAIDGLLAVVGAWQDDVVGTDSGSAYIFEVVTGQQLFKIMPSDGLQDDLFGHRVSISGDTVVVSATGNDDNGSGSGAAYVFDATTGQQGHKLLPDDGDVGDQFGVSVDIDDRVVVIGAGWDDDNGDMSGSAYIFDAITGLQVRKIQPSDSVAGDHFGLTAAVSGGRAVIGSGFDDDNGADSGSAYVFEAAVCATDINSDGVVDTSDLGILIGFFGQSNPALPQADINGDGVVDTADLGFLIGEFGTSCP